MKAIVLCAGEGTRLRPLTFSGPKHLIPVANTPVIQRVLNTIKETGIVDIGIVVSPTLEEGFKDQLGDGSGWDLNITYILQESPRGLAHAVQCSRNFIQNEPFCVYLGDNLLQHGLIEMVSNFKDMNSNAMISLYEVANPQRFGVATLKDDKIKNLIEKPADPPSNLAVIGTYLFDHNIFRAIEKIEPSPRGELEITDAIQKLIDQGFKVSPYRVKGWWKDVGKPEDMLEVNQLLLENERPDFYAIRGEIDKSSQVKGRVKVAPGAKIRNSELRGPCIIGQEVEILDSFIGPFTSVSKEVKIIKSEIEYSIVMEGSRVEDIKRLDHSLIGRNVKIGRKKRLPKTFKFVLGDDSQVYIDT